MKIKKIQQGFAKTTVAAPSASVALLRLPSLIDSWVMAGDINRHSPRTLDSKRDLLNKLVWFLGHKNLTDCGTHELRHFLHYVTHGHEEEGGRWGNARNSRPTKPRTAKNYHGILRAFFNWLVLEGEIDQSPMGRITPPVDRPDQIQPFTHEQLKKLLLAAKRSLHPRRDEAILLLLLDTGMRASEMCELRVGDIDLQEATVTVEGKGGKARHLPFSRDTKRALYNYLNEEERDKTDPVFISDRGNGSGEALTRHGLRFLTIRLGKAARVDGTRISPHTFRHTFAIEFLRAGGNVFTLQQLLGHTHLAMTNRYVAIAQADITAQHRQFSPVTRLKGGKGK